MNYKMLLKCIKKELREIVRDKRALWSMIISPLIIGPMMMRIYLFFGGYRRRPNS